MKPSAFTWAVHKLHFNCAIVSSSRYEISLPNDDLFAKLNIVLLFWAVMIHSCGQITETDDARITTLNVEMEKEKGGGW